MSSAQHIDQTSEIVLSPDTIDQLIEPRAESRFLKRRLREDAEAFIVEHATGLPSPAGAACECRGASRR
jgi:hypothetical protein